MEPVSLRSLEELVEKRNRWKCKLWFTEGGRGTSEPTRIELTQFLVPNKHDQKMKQRDLNYPPMTRYRFPDCYNGPASMEALVRDLCLDGKKSGFPLIKRSSHGKTSNIRMADVTICCTRHVPFAPSSAHAKNFKEGKVTAEGVNKGSIHMSHKKKPRPKNYKSSTKRVTDPDGVCPFHLIIFLSSDNHWYLSTRSGNEPPDVHVGHPCIDSCHMKTHLSLMGLEEKELRRQCEEAGVKDTETASLLSQRSGEEWDPAQMRYLSKKETDLVHGLTADASSADRLIESFKQRCVCCAF